MKRFFLALLFVAGCSQQTPEQVVEAQADDVVKMLHQSDAAACTNPATIQTVRSIIVPENDYSNTGPWTPEQLIEFDNQVVVSLELVTLEGVDAATSKITCRGKFVARWNGEGGEAPIDYDIKPALDTGGFVVNVFDVGGPKQAYGLARGYYYRAYVHQNFLAGVERDRVAQMYQTATNHCNRGASMQIVNELQSETSGWLERLPAPINADEEAVQQCLLRLKSRIDGQIAERDRQANQPMERSQPTTPQDRIVTPAPPMITPEPPEQRKRQERDPKRDSSEGLY